MTVGFGIGRRGGFTLIELLVVIAVIAILAGLLMSGLVAGGRQKLKGRIQGQLNEIETAISEYQAKRGSYPPSTTNTLDRPTLYYELVGAVFDNPTKSYKLLNGEADLPIGALAAFGVDGIQNAGLTKGETENFYRNLRPNGHSTLPGSSPPVQVLSVPIRSDDPFDPQHIIWHYNSQNPTNNPGKFDLWVEWREKDHVEVIGNFKR